MTICFATEAEARLEETKRHVEDCAIKVVVKSTSDLKREIRTEPRIRTILTYISIYTYTSQKGLNILKLQKNLHPVTE